MVKGVVKEAVRPIRAVETGIVDVRGFVRMDAGRGF
jgi:hypothetical protein